MRGYRNKTDRLIARQLQLLLGKDFWREDGRPSMQTRLVCQLRILVRHHNKARCGLWSAPRFVALIRTRGGVRTEVFHQCMPIAL